MRRSYPVNSATKVVASFSSHIGVPGLPAGYCLISSALAVRMKCEYLSISSDGFVLGYIFGNNIDNSDKLSIPPSRMLKLALHFRVAVPRLGFVAIVVVHL